MRKLQPWKTLESKPVYVDAPHIEILADRVELPDGQQVNNYYRMNSRPSCAIVASDESGRMIMLRQYKHGAGKICLTFPGGRLELGETIAETAKRELKEETGYEAARWQCLGEFPIHANQHVGLVSIFKAETAKCVATPNSGDLEEMEIVLVTPAEARAALKSGEIALLGDAAAFSLSELID